MDGSYGVFTVADILYGLEYYKTKTIYATTEHHAEFNAKDIIWDAIDYEYQNMYEDWDSRIIEDIDEMQTIYDRILKRSPSQNISYTEDKLIEFDL